MSATDFPLWLQWLIAIFALLGAAVALLGSWGLLRLKTYYERVHAPAIIATMGCWLIMHATWIYFSVSGQGFVMHSVLIAIFIAVTVPITTIFLMRAALFRSRRAGESVPPTLSNLVLNEPLDEEESDEAAGDKSDSSDEGDKGDQGSKALPSGKPADTH